MTKSYDWLWKIIITSSLFASAGDNDTVFNGFELVSGVALMISPTCCFCDETLKGIAWRSKVLCNSGREKNLA